MYRLIFCLFLTGCNRDLPVSKMISIDPTFQTYVNDFVTEAKNQNYPLSIDDISIHFDSSLDVTTLGECRRYSQGTPLILINQQDWPNENDVIHRVLLFHELGHCILNREHLNTLTNGIVTSIMYLYMQNSSMYSDNWAYYMHELFYPTP